MTTCPVCGYRHAEASRREASFEHGANAVAMVPPIAMRRQAEAGSAHDAILAESNVLTCCNAAFDRAQSLGGVEVRLLDLLHALTDAPTLEAWLAACDIDRDLLHIELEKLDLVGRRNGATRARPLTSWGMRHALLVAREAVARRGGAVITMGDLLAAIMTVDTEPAGRLLAEHVARQRQRRRRGMRGGSAANTAEPLWREDGALAASQTWATDAAGPTVISDKTAALSAGATLDGALQDKDHHSRSGGPQGLSGDADRRAEPKMLADDLYRLGEREPRDGWYGAPAWVGGSERFTAGSATTPASGPTDATFADSGPPVRQLMRKLAEWQAQIAARLDDQDSQLEGISSRLGLMSIAGPARRAAEHVSAWFELASADDAAAEQAGAADNAPTPRMATTVAKSAPRPMPAANDGGRAEAELLAADGRQPRPHLERAQMRANLRRTASRRRRTRAAAAKAARAQAVAQAQLEATRAAVAAAEHARRDLRLAVPAAGARGDSLVRPSIKSGLMHGSSRPLAEDDDGDEIDSARQKRFFLSMDDDIVQAPSIGPKTADRLRAHDVRTVRDLLAVKPGVLSQRLNTRHITAERITGWQHQARLVCTVPWLRGTHAQILVGSGYYAPHSIVSANRDALCTAILRFSTTREGQSVLRSAPPPSLGKIMRWVEQAAMAELDRAA